MHRLSLVGASGGCSPAAVHGLLTVVTSLIAERELQAHGFQWLQHVGSVVVVHRLSCFAVCGIFLDKGLDPCPLHGQADSYPLYHQGSPGLSL